MAGASPARSESSSYVAWGHSSAVSPWGEVIASTDEKDVLERAKEALSVRVVEFSPRINKVA